MTEDIGITSNRKMKHFVVLSPVGPYYPRGFVPVKLFCHSTAIRSWPTGFGDKKIGGNYAPTIRSGSIAATKNDCD